MAVGVAAGSVKGSPALGVNSLSSSSFSFNIAGPASSYWGVYSSTDLTAWTLAGSVTLNGSGTGTYTDSGISGVPYQFYHLVNSNDCSSAIGFVRLTVPGTNGLAGFKMIADQLIATNNNLNGLFNPMIDGTYLPSGSQIQFWNGTSYVTNIWSSGAWSPNGNSTLLPGGGAFIDNGGTNPITVSFAGLVPESVTNYITNGVYMIYSALIPKAGGVQTVFGYPPSRKDTIERWNSSGYFNSYNYYYLPSPGWSPSEPIVNVGESFFLDATTTKTWIMNYSPCP